MAVFLYIVAIIDFRYDLATVPLKIVFADSDIGFDQYAGRARPRYCDHAAH
jgi:hypothetical protein